MTIELTRDTILIGIGIVFLIISLVLGIMCYDMNKRLERAEVMIVALINSMSEILSDIQAKLDDMLDDAIDEIEQDNQK